MINGNTPVIVHMLNTSTFEMYVPKLKTEASGINDVGTKFYENIHGKNLIFFMCVLFYLMALSFLTYGCLCRSSVGADEFVYNIGFGLLEFAVIFLLQLFFYAAVLLIPALTLNYRYHRYFYMGYILALAYFIPAQLILSYFDSNIWVSSGTALLAISVPSGLLIRHIYIIAYPSDLFSLKPFIYWPYNCRC